MKHPLPFILVALVMVGCISRPTTRNPTHPQQREDRILLLDNSGGYSHAGRRIELLEDGSVIDTRYTDVIGDERASHGSYVLDDGILNLRFGDRGNQRLIRVRYRGEIFWVYANEVDGIRIPENHKLRQTALKQKGEQGASTQPSVAKAPSGAEQPKGSGL